MTVDTYVESVIVALESNIDCKIPVVVVVSVEYSSTCENAFTSTLKFDVFNLSGVIIFSGEVNNFLRISELSGFKSGVYILKIKDQDIFYPIIKM